MAKSVSTRSTCICTNNFVISGSSSINVTGSGILSRIHRGTQLLHEKDGIQDG